MRADSARLQGRQGHDALFDLPLDVGKTDAGFFVHALELIFGRFRGTPGIAELAGVTGAAAFLSKV